MARRSDQASSSTRPPPHVPRIDPIAEDKRVATAMIDRGWPNLDTSALTQVLNPLPPGIQRWLDRFRETGLKPFQDSSVETSQGQNGTAGAASNGASGSSAGNVVNGDGGRNSGEGAGH